MGWVLRELGQSEEAGLQSLVDAHHTAINSCHLSNNNHSAMESDCTEAANKDRSLNNYSYSNFNDNLATFLMPPPPACKKVEENDKHRDKLAKKKRKTNAASGSDSNGKDMVYAQSSSAFTKGLNEPLAFSFDSKWGYALMDGTSLFLGLYCPWECTQTI